MTHRRSSPRPSIDRETIETLAREQRPPAVSLFLPTIQAGPETRQNPIRFKNLLGEAEERLRAKGFSPQEVGEFCARARELVHDNDFWQHQARGLAVFFDRESFQTFALPHEPAEVSVVDDRAYIQPLLPFLDGSGRFHVLALSQKRVRLFAGDRFGLEEMDVDLPENLEAVVGGEIEESSLQHHTSQSRAGRTGGQQAQFHGQGKGDDDRLGEIRRFLQAVDAAVRDALVDGGANPPLVVAATEPLLGHYLGGSHYPNLVENGIEGNPDRAEAHDLHEPAWQRVEDVFAESRREALRRFEELAGTDRTAEALEEIVLDASFGRVEKLFVARDADVWGSFDTESGEVEVHEKRGPRDRNLIEEAALQTLRHGGEVFTVSPESLPGTDADHAAAIRRY